MKVISPSVAVARPDTGLEDEMTDTTKAPKDTTKDGGSSTDGTGICSDPAETAQTKESASEESK
ncbi:hypothetical protein Pme01_10790 [Planosporangium mesophilum]|uniref:Uncharacterized protein n=1 Tax=Planosporangium mesophilum TaxID=689768 RepID=A0A8J3T902_9ACTN|nr:hypothetical protein Pme01_10790 [Planosporangium mesophilum]